MFIQPSPFVLSRPREHAHLWEAARGPLTAAYVCAWEGDVPLRSACRFKSHQFVTSMRLLIDLNGVEVYVVNLKLRMTLCPHLSNVTTNNMTRVSLISFPSVPGMCRRKVEIMHTHSLFTLLGERLMMHTSTVTITTYNTLYEVYTCLHTTIRLYF